MAIAVAVTLLNECLHTTITLSIVKVADVDAFAVAVEDLNLCAFQAVVVVVAVVIVAPLSSVDHLYCSRSHFWEFALEFTAKQKRVNCIAQRLELHNRIVLYKNASLFTIVTSCLVLVSVALRVCLLDAL